MAFRARKVYGTFEKRAPGPLADIFNMSAQKGVFPSKLKQAKVIPVYKSDDDTERGNHRPISLISIFNRIFEKLMYHCLKQKQCSPQLSHCMVFGLKITPHVHSTLFLILLTSYKTTIDLKKAFDNVVYFILLYHYCIRGIINDWFASYFLGRSLVTEVDSYLPSKSQIPCAVPHGYVLGPLLFFIYITDIHNSSDELSFYRFADRTNLLYAYKNLKSFEETVNNELLKTLTG